MFVLSLNRYILTLTKLMIMKQKMFQTIIVEHATVIATIHHMFLVYPCALAVPSLALQERRGHALRGSSSRRGAELVLFVGWDYPQEVDGNNIHSLKLTDLTAPEKWPFAPKGKSSSND